MRPTSNQSFIDQQDPSSHILTANIPLSPSSASHSTSKSTSTAYKDLIAKASEQTELSAPSTSSFRVLTTAAASPEHPISPQHLLNLAVSHMNYNLFHRKSTASSFGSHCLTEILPFVQDKSSKYSGLRYAPADQS